MGRMLLSKTEDRKVMPACISLDLHRRLFAQERSREALEKVVQTGVVSDQRWKILHAYMHVTMSDSSHSLGDSCH